MLTKDDKNALRIYNVSGSVSSVPTGFWERIEGFLNANGVVHPKVPSNCGPCLCYAATAAYRLLVAEENKVVEGSKVVKRQKSTK